MSSTIVCQAVIGVKLPVTHKDFGITKTAGCRCLDRDLENHWRPVKFCSACGTPIIEDKNKYPQFANAQEFIDHIEDEGKKYPNWIVATTMYNDEVDDIIVGFGVSSSEYKGTCKMVPFPAIDPEEMKRLILLALCKVDPNLFVPSTFGLYSVLYYT